MLPFLHKGKRLYPWLLSALTETAVAIPWLIFSYSIQNERRWPEAMPGVWLLLLAYLAAALWEAGAPAGGAAEGEGAGGGEGDGGGGRAARRRLVAMVVGLIGIYAIAYATMPSEFRPGSLLRPNLALAVLPVAGYLWYQGARSGTDGIEYGRVFQQFTWQGVAMTAGIIMLFIAHSAGEPRVQVLLAWSVPLLFASGLTLLVVTRERELRAAQARHGHQESGGSVGSPATSGMIIGLLGLTLAASSLLSMERLARVGAAVWGVIDRPLSWMGDVVMLIVYRWVMLVGLILEPLINWLRRTPKPNPQDAPPLDGGEMGRQMRALMGPDEVRDWMPYIKALLLIAMLTLLLVGLYQLNRRRGKSASMEEERISLGFWGSLLADLRGLFARAATAVAVAAAPSADARDPRDPRALYRRLQAWGAALGRPRRAGETPTAYREALDGRQPGCAPSVAAITAVYNQARYGVTPPTEDAVVQAARAVAALEAPDRPPERQPDRQPDRE